jgi:hypothetical protein
MMAVRTVFFFFEKLYSDFVRGKATAAAEKISYRTGKRLLQKSSASEIFFSHRYISEAGGNR